MDTARYWVALCVVAGAPGALLFWFSVHPFVSFWRRRGPGLTLTLHYLLILALAAVVVVFRKPILAIEFGTQPVLVGLALACFVVTAWMRLAVNRQLSTRVLQGLPELAPERYQSRLLTEGIYSRIRHPRYLQLLVAILAYTLFANYLALYVTFVVSVIWVALLVPLEERELRQRFGEEYERYCQRVPRFLPRLSRAG